MAYRIMSADSHFVEPPNMLGERMEKAIPRPCAHTVKNLDGRGG